MSVLNAAVTATADALLAPFRGLPPLAGLTVASLLTAVLMLVVFKRTSNQARLSAVKRSIHAALFEIRLFQDDLRAILRAQAEILRHNAAYLGLSLVPMLWMIVPLLLVVAQLQFYYGYAPLRPGTPVLLKVQLRDGGGDRVSLDAPRELPVDTPAVWFPGAKEVVWRLVPAQAGRFDVRVRIGAESYAKSVQVAGGVVRRSPVRLERGLLNQLLYPSEPPLPGGATVSAITVAYPGTRIALFGWEFSWLVWYVMLSLIFAFALRRPLGVTM